MEVAPQALGPTAEAPISTECRLHPLGRLAGTLYTHVHDICEMKRPVVGDRG